MKNAKEMYSKADTEQLYHAEKYSAGVKQGELSNILEININKKFSFL